MPKSVCKGKLFEPTREEERPRRRRKIIKTDKRAIDVN